MVVSYDRVSFEERPLRLLIVEQSAGESAALLDLLRAEFSSAQILVSRDLTGATYDGCDAVLADLSAINGDGISIVAKIHDTYPDAAIVALNGPADRVLAIKTIAAGAGDYLAKDSYDAPSMASRILYAVERLHAQSQGRTHERGRLDDNESPICAVDSDGELVAINTSWQTFSAANGGKSKACGIGANYLSVCDSATNEQSGTAAQVAVGLRAVLAGRIQRFELDYECSTPATKRWFSLRILPQLTGAVISHYEITATKLAHDAPARESLYDSLTELPNRALLSDRLEQVLTERRWSDHLVGVVFLDVDNFEEVANRLGSVAAEALLVEVTKRLSLRVREGDTLARIADGKFAALWRQLRNTEEAHQISKRFAEAFNAPFTSLGTEVVLTASMGVSVDQWAQTAEELLVAAGAALQDAKRSGSGLIRVFTSGQSGGAVAERIRSEASLREAMVRNELVVHYQPVVNLANGTVVSVEALVRWEHPTEGLLGPDQFIPVAEASGLIVSLGEWVMRQACLQSMIWQTQGLSIDMAVNLSTRQVASGELIKTLTQVLSDTGMDPKRLVLEVTESAMMGDVEAAAVVFNEIGALGVSLTIDDFGTGYSSFVYLKRYPIRALKVDQSFVAGMGITLEDNAIVSSIVELANAVGGHCVAEGIETDEQFVALRSLGCCYGQGWLFGRAVPAEEVPGLVARCERDLNRRIPTMMPFGDKRDSLADKRDQAGDQRDSLADKRDQAGDQRDSLADKRDQAGDQRDSLADKREASAAIEPVEDETVRSALERLDAARDRKRASLDRLNGTGERILAERDRDAAQLDRLNGTGERILAERDRDAAQLDP